LFEVIFVSASVSHELPQVVAQWQGCGTHVPG
jgi:hypothetical protein